MGLERSGQGIVGTEEADVSSWLRWRVKHEHVSDAAYGLSWRQSICHITSCVLISNFSVVFVDNALMQVLF